MPKKKIAFVIGSLSSGGAERVISNLSNILIENFDIAIITFQNSNPFYPLDNRIDVITCLNNSNQPTSALESLRLNFLLTKRVYQIFKAEKVDISIGFITSANILATVAAKMYGIPSIICERNNPSVEELPQFWVIMRKLLYPKADKLVLQTQGVKELYEKSIKAHKLIILPNPIASELSQSRDNSIKKENLILTVGRLDKNKCQDDLITAFSNIQNQNWRLLIIGDGYKKSELIKLIDALNLNHRVEIISKVKDIDTYYNKASIFVFTSITEGFPNALLEAMHFGLPCISTNCDFGPSDLIKDGMNGYLVPLNNEIALEQRLSQLINNEELRNQFSNNAKLTTQRYESNKVVSQWEELINLMLQRQ